MSSHDHHKHQPERNLKIAFFLNLGFTVMEVAGGYYVNSMAILSDALHDLGDSFSLGISWLLAKQSRKKATRNFTFGFHRFSLLGALINSVVLIGGSIYVISAAVDRILNPQHSNAPGMVLFAVIGISVNGYAAWKISKGKSLNERVVSWHLLEDVLGWVAVLITALVLLFADIHYLDPVLSLLITVYVLYNVTRRLRETFQIFLQGTPRDIDLEKIKRDIIALDHVDSIHHLHVWSLEGEHHVFTAHIRLTGIESFRQIMTVKSEIRSILAPYSFSHQTIETELEAENCPLLHE